MTPTRSGYRPSAGRPTRENAERRHEQLLDCALEIFLDNGFQRSTIDYIATATGMAKRTIYARYPDKAALFEAAVQRAVDRWIIPVEVLHEVETEDLEETLVAIARIRLDSYTSPAGSGAATNPQCRGPPVSGAASVGP